MKNHFKREDELMKKTNNKGFTLVELIVVLVILAILAAILVPALLGYIDKARQKQLTTNAEAAYVAAQALATEYYGKHTTIVIDDRNAAVAADKIQDLTDIQESTFKVQVGFASNDTSDGKQTCIVKEFEYTDAAGNVGVRDSDTGEWTVYEVGGAAKKSTKKSAGLTAQTTYTKKNN